MPQFCICQYIHTHLWNIPGFQTVTFTSNSSMEQFNVYLQFGEHNREFRGDVTSVI